MIAHPFVAGKAQKISTEASEVAKSMKGKAGLDNFETGGSADAFRHGYWMARLTQEIGPRRASLLGKAHEKTNYRQFKKGKNEDDILPDEASSDMDFLNNDAGIEAGKRNPDAMPEKISEIIVEMISEGKMYIISRDSSGNFLDCNGEVINLDLYKGKWQNPKCVIPSNRQHL